MSKVTKTLSQLHFEDLEPRRFEDLVRQLAYDYKNWEDLEDTGKLGSDDGFDIRGREKIIINIAENENESEDENIEQFEERIWLFQCKREKSISPKKLEEYLQDIIKKNPNGIYGLIFVASCHFSKKSRDIFYTTIRNSKIQEAHLWDKSKLEDMLFQPKNDHLLFAYFGISILVRQKSLKSQIRNKLIIKRKLIRFLGELCANHYHEEILIRDIQDTHYPYSGNIKDFKTNPKWKQFYFLGHSHNGINILFRDYYAYLADDGEKWDYIDMVDKAIPDENPWLNKYSDEKIALKDEIWKFWYEIPEKNRAWLKVIKVIPYEKIVEIDEHGDTILSQFHRKVPHIYVIYERDKIPFAQVRAELSIAGSNTYIVNPDLKNRINYFPDKYKEKK